MSNARFRTALLGSGAAVALMAASVPASADELNDLKGQIEALQSKLATLEQNQVAAQQEQQYVAAPANAVVGGDKPGSFRLPGSNTSVAIGGYAKLDVIYDFDPDVGDSFGVGGIAFETPAGDVEGSIDNQFTLHAKQSRLWVKTWTPTDWGEFATHIEFDFEGGQENHLVSNSSHPRLRHAYGQLGNILAGQTWSNFNTPWQWPGTIDFNGTIGTSFLRNPQVRYTASLGDGLSLAVAIEQPDADGIACNDGGGIGTNCTDTHATAESIGGTAQDVAPDITARLQYGADWGTVAIAAVGRYFSVNETTDSTPTNGDGPGEIGGSDEAFGWGVNLAAVINLPWGKDSLGAQFIYGDGIGRYALWNVGRAFWAQDQVCCGFDVQIETFEAWGANVWIEHWWTDNLYSVAAVGYAETEQPAPANLNLNNVQATAHVNLQWQPTSRANIGIEGIYGHRQTAGGNDGDHVRIQMGFTWGFGT